MKIAVLSESPADEAAVRILAEAILCRTIDSTPELKPRFRGWPSVRAVPPAAIRQLHYHTEAEGLVLVVDGNHSPIHTARTNKQSIPWRVAGFVICALWLVPLSAASARLPANRPSSWPSAWRCQQLRPGLGAERMPMSAKKPGGEASRRGVIPAASWN